MVGVIRDLETARIAIQASLTGHLVLSTLHTNSAVGAVTRLRDMGVEPFLLSSSLIGVLAQRLIRVLDPEQREAYSASTAECQAFGQPLSEELTLYRPRVQGTGRHLGYHGRTGIYDLITVDQALRNLIHDGASELDMQQQVRHSTSGILADGWDKITSGLTSVEEVLRVTRQE
jgi:general secretion pathway protein E